MALYQRGSQGSEVARIQARLQALGFYAGPLDGDFGGGTESAVKAFQKANGLTLDGRVPSHKKERAEGAAVHWLGNPLPQCPTEWTGNWDELSIDACQAAQAYRHGPCLC